VVKQMRLIPFAVMWLLMAPLAGAHAQDNMMLLKIDGSQQRVPVRFNHEKHSALTECGRCHHDYDEFGGNSDDEARSCDTCHGLKKGGKNPVALVKAFHLQCKGCHETVARKGRYHPPCTCGGCHRRTSADTLVYY
jgi:Class III cytochrome C family